MSSARIAIATCAELPGLDPDDRLLAPALAALGIAAEPVRWDDPAADWEGFDLVAVRNTWDYPSRREQFLDWAARTPRVVNPPQVLRWTTDKRYLLELEAAGLPVVHSVFARSAGDVPAPGPHGLVVKPAVGVGSVDAGRHRDRASAQRHVADLLGSGRAAMVQPFLPSIAERGETALIFFAGVFSHAIHKGPLLPESGIVKPSGMFQPENIAARTPTAAERAAAERVVNWIDARFGVLAYARIDLVPGPGGAPVVLECELAEPSLFLGTAPGAADRMAASLAQQIC